MLLQSQNGVLEGWNVPKVVPVVGFFRTVVTHCPAAEYVFFELRQVGRKGMLWLYSFPENHLGITYSLYYKYMLFDLNIPITHPIIMHVVNIMAVCYGQFICRQQNVIYNRI